MLKESIINKIFKRLTHKHSLSQSQQQMQFTDIQGEDIRMKINHCMLRYYQKSRSDEHKRSARNWDCENNAIAKHCLEVDKNLAGIRKKLLIWKTG